MVASNAAYGYLLGAGGVYGAFAFTLYSQGVAHGNDYADPRDLVEVSGGLLLAYGGGAIIAPLASSLAMTYVGPTGLFLFIAAVAVALGSFAMVSMRARAPLSIEQQIAIVPVPATTPVVGGLDPRGEPMPEADGPTAAGPIDIVSAARQGG